MSTPTPSAITSTIKPGKAFSSSDIDDAVKALFGTGLFSDVQINQVGSSLVVKVSEYQVVNQVLFQGNKKLKDNALAIAVQLKPRGTFSQATLDSDVEAVKAAYRRIGRDDAAVTTQIMDLGDNRVNVVFNINEGGRTQDRLDQFRRQQRLFEPPAFRCHRHEALDLPVVRAARRRL